MVGTGRSARVIELDMWGDVPSERAGAQSWVLKEEVAAELAQSALGMTMEDEFHLHAIAWRIIDKAKKRYPDKPFAHIPEPQALFFLGDDEQTAQPQWIAMEKVQGDTVFNRAMREFLRIYVPDEDEMEEIMAMDKFELLDRLQDGFELAMIPRLFERVRSNGELDENDFGMLAAHVNHRGGEGVMVLTQEQYIALYNTITVLHKAGFHHRDLHPSNIFIRPDDPTPSLIDFGVSRYVSSRSNEAIGGDPNGGIYDIDVGNVYLERRIRLPIDDQWLKNYDRIAHKNWDPALERLVVK